jgi:parallel beta-helix repeat protein
MALIAAMAGPMPPALGQMMLPMAGKPGLSPALSASPPYRCAENVYVDGARGDDANAGTLAAPWKTIAAADNGFSRIPHAGLCVNVLPGTYRLSKTLILGHGGNVNAATGYVVYRSAVPQAAHLLADAAITSGGNGDLIAVWAPYIVIDGFDIDGNHGATGGHGIDGCAGGGAPANIAHHFVALNNVIHDMGGAGLSTCTADYIAWQHNVIYNTSRTNPFQVSAIDIWAPKTLAPGTYHASAWDAVPYGILAAYNDVHDNSEGPGIPPPHTDGNGIIVDTTYGSAQCPSCGTPYGGKILILGNVAYGNGGGGVHVFLSRGVTVANNTVTRNYTDPLNPGAVRGELSNAGSAGTIWVDNLAIAVPGAGVLAGATPCVSFPLAAFGAESQWARNICTGAPMAASTPAIGADTNLIGVAPALANPAGGDFTPLPSSPARGAGLPQAFLRDPKPDIGAY